MSVKKRPDIAKRAAEQAEQLAWLRSRLGVSLISPSNTSVGASPPDQTDDDAGPRLRGDSPEEPSAMSILLDVEELREQHKRIQANLEESRDHLARLEVAEAATAELVSNLFKVVVETLGRVEELEQQVAQLNSAVQPSADFLEPVKRDPARLEEATGKSTMVELRNRELEDRVAQLESALEEARQEAIWLERSALANAELATTALRAIEEMLPQILSNRGLGLRYPK